MIRIIGAVVAVILVVVGGFAIFFYVQNADIRAAQGQKLESVYVVQSTIPKGTSGAAIKGQLKVEQIPAVAVQPGIVTDLASIQAEFANADLFEGEQLVQARFSTADQLAAGGSVPVPKGLQEITVALAAPQVVGGNVQPGSRVGIVYTAQGVSTGAGAAAGATTRFLYQQVLVTRVTYGTVVAQNSNSTSSNTNGSTSSNANNSSSQSAANLMVTLAVTATQASKIVFAAEQGNTLWLTLQNADTVQGAPLVSSQNVFQ